MKITIFLLILCPFIVQGQMNQEVRNEIEMSYSENDFQVFPVGELGVLLFRMDDENRKDDTRRWEFKLYDTEFKEIWVKEADFPDSLRINKITNSGSRLFFLFDVKKKKYEKVLCEIFFNETSFRINTYNFTLPKKYNITSFVVAGNYVYFKGGIKSTGILSTYSLSDRNFKLLNNVHGKKVSIEDMRPDSVGMNVVFKAYVGKKSILYLEHYSGDELKEQVNLASTLNNTLVSGRIDNVEENKRLVIGTYAGAKSGLQGYFVASIDTGLKEDYIRYHNFSDFKNLLSHLNEKHRNRIEKRIERRRKKGKETSLVQNVHLHKTIYYNNQYLSIGEVYYPTYRTVTYACPGPNGTTALCTGTVFDGWAYSIAIVAAFDKEGHLLWDNTIEMGDFKSYTIKEFVKVSFEENRIILAYASGSSVKSKILEGDQILEEKRISVLKSSNENEKIKSASSSIEYWYGKYFVVWGSQKLKDKTEKTKRYVFYFSKVSY